MKQSTFVISLLVANAAARHHRRPPNVQLFADGLSEDADLVDKIAFRGDGTIAVGKQKVAEAKNAPAPQPKNKTTEAKA